MNDLTAFLWRRVVESRIMQGWLSGMTIFFSVLVAYAQQPPHANDPRIQIRLLTQFHDPARPCRIAKNPIDGDLYCMTLAGTIYHLILQPGENASTLELVANSHDHSQDQAMGFTIGPDGRFYIVGNHKDTNDSAWTFATITVGSLDVASGVRTWITVATTDRYPLGGGAYDHLFNAIEVSPDGQWLYVNSGSRTDHGEVESFQDRFPGLREDILTSTIFRIPAAGKNLFLPRDRETLEAEGRIWCQGVRNTFDLRFSPEGLLFGTENGPDRSMSDELNVLLKGYHYGFPWRMGDEDNPQQFPDYDPANDKLLDPKYTAVKLGLYEKDPTFPPVPAGTLMFEAIENLGPDADEYRDRIDGTIHDASDLGLSIRSVSAHRSPLGLVFDESKALAPPYQGHAFFLGYMNGDPNGDALPGPFHDAGEDLLHMELIPDGLNFKAKIQKLVTGFRNPIDSEILSNRVYVLTFGDASIWELTFPSADSVECLNPHWIPAGFSMTLRTGHHGAYELQDSNDLHEWKDLQSIDLEPGDTSVLLPAERLTANFRYYRVRAATPSLH